MHTADQSLYQQNFDVLKSLSPQLGLLLETSDPESCQYCTARQGEMNLKKELNGKTVFLHSNYSPSKEADKWFAKLKLEGVEVLYVYGIGLGYYYDAAKAWLKEKASRYLIFLEDDLAVIKRFVETKRASELLEDPQVQMHHFDKIQSESGVIWWLKWFFTFTKMDVSSLESYEKIHSTRFKQLRSSLVGSFLNHNMRAREYVIGGRTFYENFYPNMLELSKAYQGTQLFSQYKDVPAIICGAGPSLEKNIQLLGDLTDKALIFAGGSAANVLASAAIRPHFGANLDPNPTQHLRLLSSFAYEVPVFYRNRVYHKVLKDTHAARLFINGCGGYSVSQWMEDELGFPKPFSMDEGNNVVNWTLGLARLLACNPIIFVGMDLAYTDNKLYADSVLPKTSLTECDKAFLRKDINGNDVHTVWKWVQESEWISSFSKKFPAHTYINATEGGLGFDSIENMPLQKVAKEYLQRSYNLYDRTHSDIQKSVLSQITEEASGLLLLQLKDSLDRCKEFLACMRESLLALQGDTLNLSSLETGENLFVESQFQDELAYEHILKMVLLVYDKVFDRAMYEIEHDNTLKEQSDKIARSIDLKLRRLDYIIDIVTASREMLAAAIKTNN